MEIIYGLYDIGKITFVLVVPYKKFSMSLYRLVLKNISKNKINFTDGLY
jgi:hypothetical protein